MAQVEQTLRKAGYTQIHEIERDDGLWEADVSRADGRFSEVYVDPKTGEIFDEHSGRALLTPSRCWHGHRRMACARSIRWNAMVRPGRWRPAMHATRRWTCA